MMDITPRIALSSISSILQLPCFGVFCLNLNSKLIELKWDLAWLRTFYLPLALKKLTVALPGYFWTLCCSQRSEAEAFGWIWTIQRKNSIFRVSHHQNGQACKFIQPWLCLHASQIEWFTLDHEQYALWMVEISDGPKDCSWGTCLFTRTMASWPKGESS